MNEIEEIKKRYEKRKNISQDYSFFSPWYFRAVQERERKIIALMGKNGIDTLCGKKILDIGCGNGDWLRMFLRWGADPENLYGIDLLKKRIDFAKKLNPNMNFICTDAQKIAFRDGTFDIVVLATCLTSVLENEIKRRIAQEAIRVLKNEGFILWYDFRFNNPRNPDVKGIGKKEIKQLFNGCSCDFHLVTLAPLLARILAAVSGLLCDIITIIPFLRTHYLTIIKKE